MEGSGMSVILPEPGGSGLSESSLAVNRRLTKKFIAVNPVSLILIPHEKTKKPAGGYTMEPQPARDPQTVSLLEPSSQPTPQITVDGVDREVEFQLLGEWDAQVARGDTFTHKGKEWEVVDLWIDNGYEVRALVSARG
jgi:hypothetical protein